MLPDMSGIEVCRTLKRSPETGNIPVLMLTARGEEIDRVVGFELGADDYVVKPFSVRELLLRIQAVLRRAQRRGPPRAGGPRVRRLRIDRDAHRVWVDDKEVELTALEFKLLLTLLRAAQPRAVARRRSSTTSGASRRTSRRAPSTRTSSACARSSGRAGDYIETVRGVGYRFSAQPEP